MFVFCGLITEAYYVHCLGGVDWLGGVLEEQGRQPAGGLVQHCGCTEWLCPLEPVTAGGARELPQLKLQVSLVQKFKIQFWVMTLKNWTQCTLQPSQWGWLYRETSQSTHPTDCTQGWRRSPLTARAASACPLPTSLQLWTKRACCWCRSPADRESGDTKQTVFIGVVKLFLNAKPISHEKKGELLMMDWFVSNFKDYFICRNLDQESDDSADFWYLNLQATGW